MTNSGPSVKIPARRLKLIFTPDPAKPASLKLEIYSFDRFENPQSRRFLLIFTPGRKSSNKKVLHNPQKMALLGPCVKIQTRRLKLISNPDQAKQASLRL